MLAIALSIFEVMEAVVLGVVALRLAAAGLGLAGGALVALALAFGWRAVLVLVTFFAGGRGWPGWRPWLAETRAFTLAYLAMTFEPWRALLEPRGGGAPQGAAGSAAGAGGAGTRLVLLHGWCCNAGVWRPLRAAWRARGGGRPFAVTLTPVLGDIDAMSAQLARRLAPLLARREPLLLVAHSMGGLVARRWLQRDREAALRVAGLLTVGTPHAGTRLAHLGVGQAAAQMRPGSDWLAALEPLPACPVGCIFSTGDSFIAPPGAALLPGAAAMPFEGPGHFGLLRDPRLVARVADWAGRGTGATPALAVATAAPGRA